MDLLLPMRPSIPMSKAVEERLQYLRGVHELVMFVLRVHTEDMEARSHSSTVPQFQRGGKVSVIRKASFYVISLTGS
jgi:hypothetical protein